MNRKSYILLLLFMSWPLTNAHRILNNHPVHTGNWYLFSKCTDDLQWYMHDLGQAISYLFILFAAWLYITSTIKKDSDITSVFGAILFIQVVDIIHYVGWHRRCEVVLLLEGIIMTWPAFKLYCKYKKPKHHG